MFHRTFKFLIIKTVILQGFLCVVRFGQYIRRSRQLLPMSWRRERRHFFCWRRQIRRLFCLQASESPFYFLQKRESVSNPTVQSLKRIFVKVTIAILNQRITLPETSSNCELGTELPNRSNWSNVQTTFFVLGSISISNGFFGPA